MAPQEKLASVKATPMKKNSSSKPVKPPFKAGVAQTPTRSRTPSGPKTPKAGTAKKPTWKRRPPPPHSGVPLSEDMKKLFNKIRKERQAAAEAKAKEQATVQ